MQVSGLRWSWGAPESVGTRICVSREVWLVASGWVVGIYLRATQRRNKDGSVVRYVQLAHNRRVNGVTQAEVLLNLGREDVLDRDEQVHGPAGGLDQPLRRRR